MKSKISFFNKTIFKKNMTLYWPIWGVYTAILIFAQPIIFWSSCYYSRFREQYTYQDKLEDFIDVIFMDGHVYMIALVALASGMALFHYLYNHKSANMIHSFPVDRSQLFGTNVISGLLFLAMPQTISSILLMLVGACNGVTEVYYAIYWWLLVLGADIVAVAVVTFCAMFTGHIMALPVYAVIVNYFSYLLYVLIFMTVSLFGFGISNLGDEVDRIVKLFSPTECFMYNVGIYPMFDADRNVIGASTFGVKVLLVYLLIAVVLYVAAYITYKKRHVEQAGEFITVGWVKPIFRFAVALAGGYLGGILMREFLRGIGIGCSMTMFIGLLVFFGAIAFFAADMLLHKSFHVFKKKNWMRCGICMIAIVATFFGILGIGKQFEDYQPELSEIDCATLYMGYAIEFEGEDAETVLAIHKQILENKDICMKAAESARAGSLEYISIKYELKSGETISRIYDLPVDDVETYAVLKQVAELEMNPEYYLAYLFGKDYEAVEAFQEGWLEAYFADDSVSGGDPCRWESISFTQEQCKEMYEAIIADVKAGNLMKYNVQNQWLVEAGTSSDRDYEVYESYIRIMFQKPNEEHDTTIAIEEYSYTLPNGVYTTESVDAETWHSAYVSIGPECEHIIQKLIEFGAIQSAEDLYWGNRTE